MNLLTIAKIKSSSICLYFYVYLKNVFRVKTLNDLRNEEARLISSEQKLNYTYINVESRNGKFIK